MSRAFVSESGGEWGFCKKKGDTCFYVNESGKCLLPSCRDEQTLKKNDSENQTTKERKED